MSKSTDQLVQVGFCPRCGRPGEHTSKECEQRRKDAAATVRACFDRETTHLRAGTWNNLDGAEITLVGTVRDLHGPDGVCTCCSRKAPA